MIGKLKKEIVKGLNSYTGLEVVDTDNNYRRPERPFYSYKIMSIKTNVSGEGNYSEDFPKSLDERFKHDYKEMVELQPQVVISFNCYSDDIAECMDKIYLAWDYFKHGGRGELALENIVVVRVEDITDRTIVFGDRYEYRYGFDVELRFLHEIERIRPTIETYKFKKGNNK
uniref:phage neck terminator protein n=1 Tax=Anaerococcus mediterraneensis TaxID=1870984 RepID=UPI000931BFBF|nr:hypothetical protein [Anaerococcus mediterraneensis]